MPLEVTIAPVSDPSKVFQGPGVIPAGCRWVAAAIMARAGCSLADTEPKITIERRPDSSAYQVRFLRRTTWGSGRVAVHHCREVTHLGSAIRPQEQVVHQSAPCRSIRDLTCSHNLLATRHTSGRQVFSVANISCCHGDSLNDDCPRAVAGQAFNTVQMPMAIKPMPAT
jgi:hypothetical protein